MPHDGLYRPKNEDPHKHLSAVRVFFLPLVFILCTNIHLLYYMLFKCDVITNSHSIICRSVFQHMRTQPKCILSLPLSPYASRLVALIMRYHLLAMDKSVHTQTARWKCLLAGMNECVAHIFAGSMRLLCRYEYNRTAECLSA